MISWRAYLYHVSLIPYMLGCSGMGATMPDVLEGSSQFLHLFVASVIATVIGGVGLLVAAHFERRHQKR